MANDVTHVLARNEFDEYIVLSHSTRFGLNETMAFDADEDGFITDWGEIATWHGDPDFAAYAKELGYELVEE